MKKYKELVLNYVGIADFDYPTYKDQNGSLWFDTNLGHGVISLCNSSNNELDGEPESAIEKFCESYTIQKAYKESPRKLDYMFLSRLETDCKYCLSASESTGQIYEGHLYYKNVEKHIEEMKKSFNSFAEDEKPQWCSLEKIEAYEKELLDKRKI